MGKPTVSELETVGTCFAAGCRKDIRSKDMVFFGPGAFMKHEKCGAFTDEELSAAALELVRGKPLPEPAPVPPPKPTRPERPPRPPKPRRVAHETKEKRTSRAGKVRFWITTNPASPDVA